MSIFRAFSYGAFVAAAGVTSAMADDYTHYGTAEGWNVFVDEASKSCLIEKADEDMHIQMGLTKKKDMAYVGVFTKGDNGLTAGNMGDFIFFLDDEGFVGEVTAFKTKEPDGYSGAYMLTNNPNFVDGVAEKHMFKAVNKDTVFEMSLDGTKAAIAMARECIAAQK